MANINKPKTILFGASQAGEAFVLMYGNEYEIIAFADNDQSKHGLNKLGIPIISPEEITKYDFENIIITSIYFQQIRQQLVDCLGIDLIKIKTAPKRIIDRKSHKPFEDDNTVKVAKDLLLFLADIFYKSNIPYFIDHGTLLGIIRDKNILPWDDDIDISINIKYVKNTVICIKDNINKFPYNNTLNWKSHFIFIEKTPNNFLLDNKGENPNNLLNISYDVKPIGIYLSFDNKKGNYIKNFTAEIKFFFIKNGTAYQRITYSPEYHFNNADKVLFCKKKLSVPYDYEKYLELHYGEWRKPKKNTSFSDLKNFKIPEGEKASIRLH